MFSRREAGTGKISVSPGRADVSGLSNRSVFIYTMSWKTRLSLLAVGIFAALLGSLWVSSPGYMDAEYYYITAEQLAEGRGFSEPVIWNYLNRPEGIPHPSHLYWMPLTSLLAALPMVFFGAHFRVAQVPFIILTALLPIWVAAFAYQIHQCERKALLSGLLAAFAGYFFPFFLTVDAFVLYAWLGPALFWLIKTAIHDESRWRLLLVGMLVGVAHLTRADGLLLLIPVLLLAIKLRKPGQVFALIVFGYLVVIGPWLIRNQIWNSTGADAGFGLTLWFTDYNDLYAYNLKSISFWNWWQSGLAAILLTRLEAAWFIIKSLLGVNMLVYMLPLLYLGIRKNWSDRSIQAGCYYLAVLILMMTFVFPYAGARGSFFHSSAAIMPVFWSLVPIGLEQVIQWGLARREWLPERAWRMYASALVFLSFFITAGIFLVRVVGLPGSMPGWQRQEMLYAQIEDQLKHEIGLDAVFAVNNPPGFNYVTGRPAVVIPSGEISDLQAVVQAYAVEWIILDQHHDQGLHEIYLNPERVDWFDVYTILKDEQDQPIYIIKIKSLGVFP